MSAVLPNKATTTNPPKNTFVEATQTLQDGYLLYQPDQNAFIALYPEEFFACRKVGEENNQAIQELQEANQTVTEKSLALSELLRAPNSAIAEIKTAQDELDQALADLAKKSDAAKTKIEKITDLKTDHNKLVEVLPLTLARDGRQKAFYIPAEKLKAALADKRVYLVDGKAERSRGAPEKLLNGMHLNGAEVKRRIENQVIDKFKFSKKWKLKDKDGDEYAGQFFSAWSKTMGADAKAFLEREQQQIIEGIFGAVNANPADPHRNIDLKSEAQLMRWAAGAGLEANFLPFQGNFFDKRDKNWNSKFKRAAKAAQFNVKANAEASFAVGEARVQTIAYYPHFAGWHAQPAAAGVELDMGHFRFRGDMTLYAVAGASVALEASAALMLTASKQGLRGVPKDQKAGKARAGGKGEVGLFAGLKEGVDLSGALQWLNPEGFIDDKSPKRKDPSKAWGEYADVASVGAGVAAIQGLAAKLGFEVGYNNGKFVVAANAAGCLGLGGSGNIACTVGADSIGQFFMCVAHQLKHADYTKLTGLMKSDIFYAFNHVMYMVAMGERELREFGKGTIQTTVFIEGAYNKAVNAARAKGDRFIQEIEAQLRGKWGWFVYMPPEARGAMTASITEIMSMPKYANNSELRQLAAFSINELIGTMQSEGHIKNTLDRITTAMGDVPGRGASIGAINAILAGTQFAGAIDRADIQLAKASPLIQRPFLRNDESSFLMAQLPLHHSSAMT